MILQAFCYMAHGVPNIETSGRMVGCQPTMAGHSRTSPGHPRVAPATMERTRRHSCDRPADILTTDNKLVEIQFIFNHLWKTCTAYHTCIPHTPAYNSRALTFSDCCFQFIFQIHFHTSFFALLLFFSGLTKTISFARIQKLSFLRLFEISWSRT